MPVNAIHRIKQTFLAAYHLDAEMPPAHVEPELLFGSPGVEEMYGILNGASFDGGLYRLHQASDIPSWTRIVSAAFPQYGGRFQCFGFDWLGRMFALDQKRLVGNQPGVLMFEIGTGQALEIPANFLSFHCDELVEYAEAALALSAYREWKTKNPEPLTHYQCVGYKVPLFLGGVDVVGNMERVSMEVYWELCSQLLQQARTLPDGTSIQGVS